MSGTIITPSNARRPDSASAYQYLVEKMRLAAEWRDNTFIPTYQQGDVVFYQSKMYIKKNVAPNNLVNPATNTADWISLSDYIYKEAGNNFGAIDYDNAGVNYKNYLNTLTDEEKINPKVFNAAAAAYNILLDKGITRGGNYSFTTRTKTGGPANSYYEVQFHFQNIFYIQAWAINNNYRTNGAPNDYSRPYYYVSTNGLAASYTPVNAIEQLGYTPAKVGDSWISIKASYTSGSGWAASNILESNPDLINYTIGITSTNLSTFYFVLLKNGVSTLNTSYNYFIQSESGNTSLVSASKIGEYFVIVSFANIYLSLSGADQVIYGTTSTPAPINITIFFKNNT